jgi:hypothetical protein
MSSGGGGNVGFCGTTKNHIDYSASYTADYSGVGRRGRTQRAVSRFQIKAWEFFTDDYLGSGHCFCCGRGHQGAQSRADSRKIEKLQ